MGLRIDFYRDLKNKIIDLGGAPLCKFIEREEATIKLKGIALFKIIHTPNKFGSQGCAIYRYLSSEEIDELGFNNVSISNGKNKWILLKLIPLNKEYAFNLLIKKVTEAIDARTKEMSSARRRRTSGKSPKKKDFPSATTTLKSPKEKKEGELVYHDDTNKDCPPISLEKEPKKEFKLVPIKKKRR